MADPPLPEGITCACGRFEKFSPYVYAHWTIALVYTCPQCKRRYEIIEGTGEEITDERPKETPRRKPRD